MDNNDPYETKVTEEQMKANYREYAREVRGKRGEPVMYAEWRALYLETTGVKIVGTQNNER